MWRGFMKLIFGKTFFLSFFIALNIYKLIYSFFSSQEDATSILYRFLAFLVYFLLAICSYKNIKFTTLIISVLILITGLGSIAVGLYFVSGEQILAKGLYTLLGIYLSIGSIFLMKKPEGMQANKALKDRP